MTSPSYEIRVTGILPPGALRDFEGLAPSVRPVETLVHGQLPDQAALHGLLARLEMLGVQILEVRRLHDRRAGQLSRAGEQNPLREALHDVGSVRRERRRVAGLA